MMALPGAYDVWEIVKKGNNEPKDETTQSQIRKESLKDLRKIDKKSLYLMYQALDGDGFEKISNATSAKKAWKKLQISSKNS